MPQRVPPPRLVPVLIYAIVGVITVCILFAQPSIRQTIHDQQVKTLDQQVQLGKMTQAQEDQALQMMERFTGPTMLSIFGSVGVVLEAVSYQFFGGPWCCGCAGAGSSRRGSVISKPLKSPAWRVIIVLSMVISHAFWRSSSAGSTSAPAWRSCVSDFDPKNRVHLLLGAANMVYFWHTAVLGIGLAKLSGGSTAKTFDGGIYLFASWRNCC